MDTSGLTAALTDLSDDDLILFALRTADLALQALISGQPKLCAAFHSVAVLAAEQEDHRRHITEAARVDLDGDDRGEIVSGDG